MLRELQVEFSKRALARLLLLLIFLAGGFVTPARAYNASCSIGVNNSTVLANDSFGTVTRTTMPASVSKATPITGSCAASVLLLGGYQWILTPKSGQLTMTSGTTTPAVLAAVARSFTLSVSTIQVNDSLLLGAGSQYSITTVAGGGLSALTSQLSAGTYVLTENVDVQRQNCTTLLILMLCSNDGSKQTMTVNYTLTVVDPPPPPPPPPPTSGSGSTVTGTRKSLLLAPNPWTVSRNIVKFRCDI